MRRQNFTTLVLALLVVTFCTCCGAAQTPTDAPLDTLVLQETDLAEDAQWIKDGPLAVDDLSHPLSAIGGVPVAEVVDSYHIFAVDSGAAVGNYAVRYTSEAYAVQEWENVVRNLQETPGVETIEVEADGDQTYAATFMGEEGTTIYWGTIQESDVLLLLFVESFATEASDTLFAQSLQMLEQRIGVGTAIDGSASD